MEVPSTMNTVFFYIMKLLVCPESPIIFINPMHHAVTMASQISFCSAISGVCQLWSNESNEDQSTGPHQVTRN